MKRCRHCGGEIQLLKAEDPERTEWLHVREGEPPARFCPGSVVAEPEETIGEWASKLLDVQPSGRHRRRDGA